jgi:hypothetical protein
VRTRLLVAALALAAGCSAAALAHAQSQANGLPAYTDGYARWPRLNATPIRGGSPAHSGIKNVYASRRRAAAGRFPDGTVVVKTIRAGAFVDRVAVMRKSSGRWRYVEYTRPGPRARFSVLAQGELCLSCHVQARARDYVFTRG